MNNAKALDRLLALHPDNKPARIFRAFIEVDQRADTGPWRVAIEKILAEDPASAKDPFVTGHALHPCFVRSRLGRRWLSLRPRFPKGFLGVACIRILAVTFGWV